MTRVALPGYADITGNVAVYMTSHRDGDREEFAMVTVWESLDAIGAPEQGDPPMPRSRIDSARRP